MANTLTGLIPAAYAAMNVVSRELVGFIPAAARSGSMERAAVNQNVTIPIAPAANVSDNTPAMAVPEPTDQTIGNTTMTISKSRSAEFGYTGEEQRGLNNGGPGVLSIQAQQIAEGLRALTNEIETDLAAAAYKNASRAYGTAGTTPFASDLGDSAQIRKILDDNGAPMSGRYNVMSTASGAAMRTLTQLTKANEAGEASMLRQGVLLDIHGIAHSESGQAVAHTKGTGASYILNDASSAIGDTTIAVDTGSGTVLAGDVVTFAGDSNKYVVATALASGSFTINEPGLRVALADNAAVTVGASYTANVAFASSSLVLGARLPALPKEGDLADDRFAMVDPRSGLVFEMAIYKGYKKNRYEIGAAWGVKGLKSEHSALLLG